MNYYIGIDVGTTALKAVAFSETGEVLANCSFSYTIQHPQPEYSEQNPDEIFEAVIKGLQEITQKFAPDYPRFVAFSTAMHSLIAVDNKGNLLTQCIIWADNRAAAVAEELHTGENGKLFYEATGVPVHPMSPLCKLLWFKQNEPDIFNAAYKFIGIKEYFFYKLFGEFLIDTSIASATGLFNFKTLNWDEQVLHFLAIDAVRLSAIVPANHVCYYQNIYPALSLPVNTPFIIGGGDGALSNIGSGAIGNEMMAVNIGTSSAARMLVSSPETDAGMRTFCYHVSENNFIVGGASNNGAVVLQWLKEHILKSNDSYQSLFDQAATVAPGCNGLLMLPYILGERAPIWNAYAKGTYFGISMQHSTAHLIRATLEGVVYAVYSIGKIIAEKRNITEIHASGGFTKSSIWVQMLADIFNTKVIISGALESVAFGAVIIGAKALNINSNFNVGVLETYYPDENNHQVYQASFKKFERIYELLKDEMA